MAHKTDTKQKNPREISDDQLDEFLGDCESSEDLFGDDGLFKNLKRRLVERMLQGELTAHLGYEKHSVTGNKSGNSRNGSTVKKVRSDDGELVIEVPRDRNGTFDPVLIEKYQRAFPGFDDKILSLYSTGVSTEDITEHLQEIYGVTVSKSLISTVTSEVSKDVEAWRNRPLEEVYPIVYFDALVVKVREDFRIRQKAVHLAIGINTEGERDILGMWVGDNEGAGFWLDVLKEIQNRGVKDIFIACVDGLKGFPQAIKGVFPETEVQLCIVHLIRNSLKNISYKDRKAVVGALRKIYNAVNEEEGLKGLENLKESFDEKYPSVSKIWENNWSNIKPIFSYPKALREKIYTTNAIESLNCFIRKIIKNKRVFPTVASAERLIYLALKKKLKKWDKNVFSWKRILPILEIHFGERLKRYVV